MSNPNPNQDLSPGTNANYNEPMVQPGGIPQNGAMQFAVELAQLAHDQKCQDIVALDVRGVSSVTDYTIIATGTSDRQMRAVAENIMEHARRLGQRPFGYCGFENAAWIIVDFVDVVVHLFAGPYRSYYDLELLWGDAPRLSWARSDTA